MTDLEKDTEGEMYVMQCEQFYKIGMSHDSLQRLSHIQSANPFKVKLVAAMIVDNARETEAQWHRKYKRYRVRGEWFCIPDSKILDILFFVTYNFGYITKDYKPVFEMLKEQALQTQRDKELEQDIRNLKNKPRLTIQEHFNLKEGFISEIIE